MFYDSFIMMVENRKKEKSDKYNFQNLIPGQIMLKKKSYVSNILYNKMKKLRTVSYYSNNAINFLKSKTQNERLSVQYKYR